MIKKIGDELVRRGCKISTAESCTAGYISNLLTGIAGSSAYFEGSLVVYSNKAKINVLGVERELVEEYTEVSEQVACRMAEKVKELMGTEYSIATTGYADVDGFGRYENPPGTIYVATSSPEGTFCKRLDLKDSRSRNVYLASMEGLDMIKDVIKNPQTSEL